MTRDLPIPQVWVEGEGWVMEDELENRGLFNASRYILGGRTPIKCEDLQAWGEWMRTANRLVCATSVEGHRIETVFTGMDAAVDEGQALLFRSTVTGPAYGSIQDNYPTWDEAARGHDSLVTGIAECNLFNRPMG